VNGDHLVSESMRRVQQVSGFGQQHEIPGPLSRAAGMIAFGHVSESLNRRSTEKRGPGVQRVGTIAQQV
jgi:hypothetical protein